MTRRDPPSGSPEFPELPELPSDEELGIAGMELDEGELEALLADEDGAPGSPAGPTAPAAGAAGAAGAGSAAAGAVSGAATAAASAAPPRGPRAGSAVAGSGGPGNPGGGGGGRDGGSGGGGGGSGGGRGGGPRGGGSGRGAGEGGRRARWVLALLTLVVLAAGGWAMHPDRAVPAPVAANAPATVFSSARALTHLVELARAPRPVGAPEHDRVRALLVGWLEELGLEPEVHETVSLRRVGRGDALSAVTVRNVVGRLPGERPPGARRDAVLLTAHYDAVPLSHGAGDAGLGVVAIIETLRALQASRAAGAAPLQNDLLLLFTDAEEIGLLGARAFVESHPAMDDVRVVLSAEMRGVSGPVHMFETGAENGWIVEQMQAADPHPRAQSLYVEGYRRMPNDTDFTPFREAGIQGLNFAGVGGAEHYHEPTDRPGVVSEATLQHMGARLLALAEALGGADLTEVHAPDRVFSTFPVVGIVSFPARWALPLSVAVVLLWGVAAAVALRRARGGPGAGGGADLGGGGVGAAGGAEGGRGGIAFGLGVGVALLLAGAGWLLGTGLLRLLPRVHPEFGLFTPLVRGQGAYALALVLAVATLGVTALALVARRLPLPAFVAGLLLPLAGVVLGTGALVPLVSLEFQVALAGGALGLLALAATGAPVGEEGGGRRAPTLRLALGGGLALLLALPVLAGAVPTLAALTDGLTLRVAPFLGILAALVVTALAPSLLLLLTPNRLWAPAAGLAIVLLPAGVGLTESGLFRALPSDARPLPSTLIWLQDEVADGSGALEARWLTRDDPGLAWAERSVGPFGDPASREDGLLPGSWREAPAPVAPALPRPEVRLVEVTAIGAVPHLPGSAAEGPGPSQRVAFTLRSSLGAERLRVRLPEGAAIREVEGIRPPDGPEGTPGARRDPVHLLHQGRPRDSDGLHLVVEVPAGLDLLRLEVVEEHLRAPELLADALAGASSSSTPFVDRPTAGAFTRPAGLQPSARGLSDRAFIRTWIPLLLTPPDAADPGTRPGEGG